MELNRKAFGLAGGVFWGALVMIMTLWVVARGGGEHLGLLDKIYLGYSVSPVGAVIGLLYGLVDGFLCAWVFAWLYNRFLGASPKI